MSGNRLQENIVVAMGVLIRAYGRAHDDNDNLLPCCFFLLM